MSDQPPASRLSRKAKRAFETLGEELKRLGVLHFVLLYDPAVNWNWTISTFDNDADLERVLAHVIKRVQSGAHRRGRATVVTEDDVRRAFDKLGPKPEPGDS